MWSVNTSVTRRHLLHCSRYSVLCWDRSCRDVLLRVSVSDSGVDSAPFSPQKGPEVVDRYVPLEVVSLLCAVWTGARKKSAPGAHRVYKTTANPRPLDISLSSIASGIRQTGERIEHQAIILLLRIDPNFGNARQRITQRVRRFRRAVLLPVTTNRQNLEMDYECRFGTSIPSKEPGQRALCVLGPPKHH